jgi:hypothetical protein
MGAGKASAQPSEAEALLARLDAIAASSAGKDETRLAADVATFLAPLLDAASVGPNGAAPLAVAKRFAPFLVALLGKALGRLRAPLSTSGAVATASSAVAGLRAARAALKGRPLEVELQTHTLARKVTAGGHHACGADFACRLYLTLAAAHGRLSTNQAKELETALQAVAGQAASPLHLTAIHLHHVLPTPPHKMDAISTTLQGFFDACSNAD